MKVLKQALGGLGALTIVAVIVAFIAPKTAHALAAALVQIVPGTTTLVGQNESQLVSLFCAPGKDYCSSEDLSGALCSAPYVVPSGYTLIVTDWEWFGGGGQTGILVEDSLVNIIGDFILATSWAPADGAGNASTHERYVTGIRLSSGTRIFDYLVYQRDGQASIQGYLVPNN
jgi:hypothetical protein